MHDIATLSDQYSVQALLDSHPAFQSEKLIGTPGYSMPTFASVSTLEICVKNTELLNGLGLTFSGKSVAPSFVVFEAGAKPIKLSVILSGAGDNVVVVEAGSTLSGRITFEGGGHAAVFCRNRLNAPCNLTAVFRSKACGLWFGHGGVSNNVSIWIDGPNQAVQVGDDYLFSWGIWLRCADGHAIIDVDTKSILNSPRGIIIGPHVWLGQDSKVFPGAKIGAGSVIGAGALVTSVVAPRSVALGVPARVVKQNVSWTHLQHPDEASINDMIDFLEFI